MRRRKQCWLVSGQQTPYFFCPDFDHTGQYNIVKDCPNVTIVCEDNPGKGVKAMKAKTQDSQIDNLNSRFRELQLQQKYDVLLCQKTKNESLVTKTDLSCFRNNSCDFTQDLTCNECNFEASCK